jgi:uncharacterized protein (TIGR03067 family)
MGQLLTAVVAAFVGSSALAQSPTPAPAAKHPLAGVWVIAQLSGNAPPADVALVLTVADDGGYVATVNGKVEERGTIRVDRTKKPMTLDFVIADGSSAGKTQLGVYELAGDTLKMALATPGAPTRPADFTIAPPNEVIVLKKKPLLMRLP